MMKMEMLYAVFVKFNGNTDNACSGNAGFDLTLREEIMVFNTKYILYNIMKCKKCDFEITKENKWRHNYCHFNKVQEEFGDLPFV